MSEIMTVARLPGAGGFQDYGRLTREDIIKRTRDMARHEVDRLQKILDAPDDAFNCKIVRGARVQHLIERLEPEQSPQESGRD
jgi:hypothetical protein